MSDIAKALANVHTRIASAARACGRLPSEVRLVAVSKHHPAESVREALASGHTLFGENYAQELSEKALELASSPDLEWHFIGHLQRNKAKRVAGYASMLHTLDSLELAAELDRQVNRLGRPPLKVLIEVNVAGEGTKNGVTPDDAMNLAASLEGYSHLRLRGLMTMAPADNPERAKQAFEGLRELRERIGAAYLPELSMGMSGDLELAIAAGATLVRVGTAIFGSRRGATFRPHD